MKKSPVPKSGNAKEEMVVNKENKHILFISLISNLMKFLNYYTTNKYTFIYRGKYIFLKICLQSILTITHKHDVDLHNKRQLIDVRWVNNNNIYYFYNTLYIYTISKCLTNTNVKKIKN